jgi:hypothetical protein
MSNLRVYTRDITDLAGRGVFKGWVHGTCDPPFTVFYTLFIFVDLLIFHARSHGGILEYLYIMII